MIMRFKNILTVSIVVYVNLALFFAGYLFVANTVKDDFDRAVKKTGYLKHGFEVAWHRKTNRVAYESQQKEVMQQIA